MSATQLSFSLRVSSTVKTVHLLGSWDNYTGQLPLSKGSKGFKGTFRFQQTTLEAGQRYWYYYIIDGYHVAHNPAEAFTKESTTGRQLNILDVAKSSSSSSSKHSSSSKSSSSSSRHSSSSSSSSRHSRSSEVAKGRPLSVSQIKAPKPVSPHATKNILNADFADETIDELAERFGSAGLDDDFADEFITDFACSSPASSTGSSLSYRSDSSSPNSTMSGYSTPASDCSSCTCERYGITRKGDRVRLDCGGSRCGFDSESDCSSEDEEYTSSRRNGIVVRN